MTLDPDALPVLDLAVLARATFDDGALQRELLELFEAQCDGLLAELARPSAAKVAFAAHALKGAANAIGAIRVASHADRLEAGIAAGMDRVETASLARRLGIAITQARAAVAGRLREM